MATLFINGEKIDVSAESLNIALTYQYDDIDSLNSK